MKHIVLPYGKGYIDGDIPDNRYNGSLVSRLEQYAAPKHQIELVQMALEHPIGSSRLSDMATGKKKVVILASDHTRPVPSRVVMPLLLKEIRRGNPNADITILIATGLHRETTREELITKFGQNICDTEKIVVHDCNDTKNLIRLGQLPSGGELVLNRIACEADLLLSEGFIEPHFFAGFSGGRKSVLPGIAGRETVCYNHNAEFIASPYARAGITNRNPIHKDMLYAARVAHLAFICNVVLNSFHEILYAVAGDCDKAHIAGQKFLMKHCQVDSIPADIVICTNGGHPLDQNIYQAVKGMTTAESTLNNGGVIIMVAKSEFGHGAKSFYDTLRSEQNIDVLAERLKNTPRTKTRADQWQSQIFIRILQKASAIIYISDVEDDVVRALHMTPAHSISEAIDLADQILAKRGIASAGITVIPDGVSVVIRGIAETDIKSES